MIKHRVIWSLLIILGIIWAFNPAPIKEEPTSVKLFCAYGRVFVEFHEKSNIWGVIMLDNSGRPIPCQDDEDADERTHENTNYRGMI